MSRIGETLRLVEQFHLPKIFQGHIADSLRHTLQGFKKPKDFSKPYNHFDWHPANYGIGLISSGEGWLVNSPLETALQNKSIRYYLTENSTAVLARGRFGWTELKWEYTSNLNIGKIEFIRYDKRGKKQVTFTETSTGEAERNHDVIKTIRIFLSQEDGGFEIKRILNPRDDTGPCSPTTHMVITSNEAENVSRDIHLGRFTDSLDRFLTQMADTRKKFDSRKTIKTLYLELISTQ